MFERSTTIQENWLINLIFYFIFIGCWIIYGLWALPVIVIYYVIDKIKRGYIFIKDKTRDI